MRVLLADCSTFTLGITVVVSEDGKPITTAKLPANSIADEIAKYAQRNLVDQIYLVGNETFTSRFKSDIESKIKIPTNYVKERKF